LDAVRHPRVDEARFLHAKIAEHGGFFQFRKALTPWPHGIRAGLDSAGESLACYPYTVPW